MQELDRYLFQKKTANKKYIYYVYIVYAMFCAKKRKYPMGILWVWYGYPMV